MKNTIGLLLVVLISVSTLHAASTTTSYFLNVEALTNVTARRSVLIGTNTLTSNGSSPSSPLWNGSPISSGGMNDTTHVYFPPVGGFTNSYLTNVFMTNLAAGVRDIFTVPAGYYAYSVSSVIANSTNASSIACVVFLNQSGNYRRFTSSSPGSTTATTNNPTFLSSLGMPGMLAPGYVVALSNSAAGLSVNATFKLIPSTNPLVVESLFGLSTSPTLLYTTPVGKVCLPMNVSGAGPGIVGNVRFGNDSGGSRIYRIYVVPSGLSADASTLVSTSAAVNNTGINNVAHIPILYAGDSVYVASDSATELQWAYFFGYEYTP